MLDRLGNEGRLTSTARPISFSQFSNLNEKTKRVIARGKRLENLLNGLGDVFEFTTFFYKVQDLGKICL